VNQIIVGLAGNSFLSQANVEWIRQQFLKQQQHFPFGKGKVKMRVITILPFDVPYQLISTVIAIVNNSRLFTY